VDVSAPTAAGRFVGQSIKRREDPRLLTGHGAYVDDVPVAGVLHVAFLRSQVARGRIARLDARAARALPGVRAVLTAADLNPIAGPMKPTMLLAAPGAPLRPLADGDVRFVGEPIAVVVADSRYVAEDAVELIEMHCEPLDPVLDYERGADSEDLVHPELGSNVAAEAHTGEDPQLDAAFAGAAHVVEATFWQHRQTNAPMETRGIVARWDPYAERLRVWISSQAPHEVRLVCARLLGVAENQVRVTQQDVGGGFGQKFFMPRDEMVVVLAARHLGAAVKWIEDRQENLLASNHARAERLTCRVGVDADGHIVAAHADHLEDVGAFPVGGAGGVATFVVSLFPGPYRIPRYGWRTRSVWTNTCGRGAYRGPWQMETVAREQMLDVVAREIGMDPLELRRRNVVCQADLPYTNPSGMTYDAMSPDLTLEQAAGMIAYDDLRRCQADARAKGRLYGVGIGLYIEPQTGVGPMGVEGASLRVEPNGAVNVYVGCGNHGQGLETTVAQVAAEHLGVDVDDVVVHQGDTDSAPFGNGTGGSRSGPILSGAVREAALAVRDKALTVAAHLMEAAPEDLQLAEGVVSVRGTPTSSLPLAEVARTVYHRPGALPAGALTALEAAVRWQAPPVMWSNACHMCACEVDGHTGAVRVERYVVSEDCGAMINPMVVEGQVAGGVVQGVGGVLFEEFVYDGAGNPLTTTFLDYCIPTAAEVPDIEYGHIETPAFTPGGYKGMGEGGAIGAPPCLFNAVADALAPVGVQLRRQPLAPSRVLGAITAARPGPGGNGASEP
jgi:carbon-monoxide dehydrogenase large subunit